MLLAPKEPSEWSYRRMRPTDLAWVSETEQATFSHPWGLAVLASCLETACWATILEVDDQPAGFAIFLPVLDEAELLNFAIAPTYQHQGWGKRFLSALVATLLQKGCQQIFLEVRASNQPAIQLYESLGFSYLGLRKAYYPSEFGREDAKLYRLELPPFTSE